ncbi:TerD family protein [Microbacterium sp. 77mftsu3.1]|uniref:TerD family protein n=1 Tax=Microbacterium sp. 77mftsu3.1 TaxID=1761802 RepID=UPI000373ADAF|nr:TerD family protein [Microbacterium sp. 77mftsu3.1]SDH48920.1 tellurium resistance protein TerZ [Microbacterium sp. 77mftsu3.1]
MTALTLQKSQSLTLAKADGSALTKVRLGLGWDAVRKGGFFGFLGSTEIDLDASAILISGTREVDTVFYGHLRSGDGSIRHTGDNLTGDGDGDDEQIIVDLQAVPASVDKIVFVITSYSGQTFDQVENVFARVVDLSGGREEEVVRYDLGTDGGNGTANIIAKLTRTGSGWDFTALGTPAKAKTPSKLVPAAISA